MKKVILIPVVVAVLIFSSGFYDGQTVKERRDVTGFSKVNFGVPGELFIEIGPQFQVILEGNQKFIDNIETERSGEKLNIKAVSWRLNMNEKVTVYITMPSIEGLSVSGSGRAEVMDAVKGDEIRLNVSGSGKVMIPEVDVANLECNISGSGTVNVSGSGKIGDAEIAISGSGDYKGGAAEIQSLDVAISGSGNCFCNVRTQLEATISGSGNIVYSGNPRINAKVSGSGKVRSR